MSGALPARALPDSPKEGRVALFGGSFNPPHISHALAAMAVLQVEPVDALWVLPCADHPFGKGLAPFEDRVALCELAFRDLAPRVQVAEIEASMPAPNFTVQTLRAIRAARPALELCWVIGTDIVEEMHLWREPDELPKLCDLIVVPREGYARQGVLEAPIPAISSTEVRARLGRGDDVSGIVARQVRAAIAERGLYGPDDGPQAT